MSEYIFFSVEMFYSSLFFFFFFNDTATTEIYTLSLHDALPISGIFLTHMVDAFEVARNVLDLPTLLGTALLALHSTARTGSLFRAQLVDLGGDRKIFEVGQRAPPLTPLHSPQFVRRLARSGDIFRMNRPLL